MTYYVLTKRSAPSDGGKMSQHVYGITPNANVARAWYRATRVTDVFELDTLKHCRDGFGNYEIISDTRLESWREQAYKNERLAAAITK